MKWSKQKCRKVAFVISLCYVLLGTITVMMGFGEYNVLGLDPQSNWYWAMMLFTLPVSFFVFGGMYATTSVWAIIIPAVIMLMIIWGIVYWILKKIKMK